MPWIILILYVAGLALMFRPVLRMCYRSMQTSPNDDCDDVMPLIVFVTLLLVIVWPVTLPLCGLWPTLKAWARGNP